MTRLTKLTFILGLILYGGALFADVCDIPQTSSWYFAILIANDRELTPGQKSNALAQACHSIDPDNRAAIYMNRLSQRGFLEDFRTRMNFVMSTDIPDAFRNIGRNKIELELAKGLEQIKAEPSAALRVRKTYELVLRFKKPYFDADQQAAAQGKQSNRPVFLTPEETLKTGGVCRDFARLLNWALLQVARSSSESRDAETFSFDRHFGYVGESGHMWNSVNLPIRDSAGLIVDYQTVDLDITNFTSVFVPLPQYGRHQPSDRLKADHEKCEQIAACLRRAGTASHP